MCGQQCSEKKSSLTKTAELVQAQWVWHLLQGVGQGFRREAWIHKN